MNTRLLATVTVAAGLAFGGTAPANAVGCISGGIAGAAVGHLAHHGVLGAIGGCIAGHQYAKRQKQQAAQQQQMQMPPQTGDQTHRTSDQTQ